MVGLRDLDIHISRALAKDAPFLSEIHETGIQSANATFETTPRSAVYFRKQIAAKDTVILVVKKGQQHAGFANVSPIEDRCTQAGVGEYGIYLAPNVHNLGIGKILLPKLLTDAKQQGYYKVIGRIFDSNPASLRLAELAGFRTVGTLQRHGKIAGVWKNVVLVEKHLDAA